MLWHGLAACATGILLDIPLFQTAQKYSLSACVIPKSMSSILNAIMCQLHDEARFEEAKITVRDFAKARKYEFVPRSCIALDLILGYAQG